jgi:acetoacetate decarboxylase
MDNPRHREALALFSAQSSKLRSEFVIDCILKAQQENRIEEVIRQTITDTLAGISLRPSVHSDTSPELHATENISDLPEVLICSLDDI